MTVLERILDALHESGIETSGIVDVYADRYAVEVTYVNTNTDIMHTYSRVYPAQGLT